MKATSFDQLKALWDLIWKMLRKNLKNLNGDQVQEAITNRKHEFWVKIGEAMEILTAVIVTTTVVKQVVKYVLVDMITAGHYDYVNSDITERNFPMPENLVLGSEPKLFHFDCEISSKNAIAKMNEDGYRPATIWDLLDFGAKNPEEQRKYQIIALGSVASVGGDRYVAYLYGYDSERSLGLYWFDFVWVAYCRFLAVRK